MLHVTDDGSACLVTGPAARLPPHPIARPCLRQMERRGIVDLSGTHPVLRQAIRHAFDRRRLLLHLPIDGLVPLVAYDHPDPTFGFARHAATLSRPELPDLPRGIVFTRDAFAPTAIGRSTTMAWRNSAMGSLAPSRNPIQRIADHEMAHAVVSLLTLLPGAVEALERRVALAIGVPGYRFASAAPHALAEIAAQVGRYGAHGALGPQGADDPRPFDEQGAEALHLVFEYGRSAPPISRAWLSVALACFAADDPLARQLGRGLYDGTTINHYLERSSPRAVARAAEEWGPALQHDPHFAWEQENPLPPSDDALTFALAALDVPDTEQHRERLRKDLIEGKELDALETTLCHFDPPAPLADLLARRLEDDRFGLDLVSEPTVYSNAEIERLDCEGVAYRAVERPLGFSTPSIERTLPRATALRRRRVQLDDAVAAATSEEPAQPSSATLHRRGTIRRSIRRLGL